MPGGAELWEAQAGRSAFSSPGVDRAPADASLGSLRSPFPEPSALSLSLVPWPGHPGKKPGLPDCQHWASGSLALSEAGVGGQQGTAGSRSAGGWGGDTGYQVSLTLGKWPTQAGRSINKHFPASQLSERPGSGPPCVNQDAAWRASPGGCEVPKQAEDLRVFPKPWTFGGASLLGMRTPPPSGDMVQGVQLWDDPRLEATRTAGQQAGARRSPQTFMLGGVQRGPRQAAQGTPRDDSDTLIAVHSFVLVF